MEYKNVRIHKKPPTLCGLFKYRWGVVATAVKYGEHRAIVVRGGESRKRSKAFEDMNAAVEELKRKYQDAHVGEYDGRFHCKA